MDATALPRALDLAGVGVFAVSGALAAGRRRLDLLGVLVVAIVTAIGGGTLRDLLLGRKVFWVADAACLWVILAAAAATIVYTRFGRPPVSALLVADALGLALFTVSGCRIAETVAPPRVVVVLMGAVTGAAGGVMRDILCNEIPLILTAGQLYATAAIAGAAVYVLLRGAGFEAGPAGAAGMMVVAGVRIAAIVWGLKLPVYELRPDAKDPGGR